MIGQSLADRFCYERRGGKYYLTQDLVWEAGYKGSGLRITIPAGFEFESSVPRFARWLVSPHHKWWLLAACVHDYALERGHPRAFCAGEWLVAARALATEDDPDPKRRLVRPAYHGICIWTVR